MEELKNLKYVFAIFILSIIILALLILEPNSKVTLFVTLFGSLLQILAAYGSLYAAKASEKTIREMMNQNKLAVKPILYINDGEISIDSNYHYFETTVFKAPTMLSIENYGKGLAKSICISWSHNLNLEEIKKTIKSDGNYNISDFLKNGVELGHKDMPQAFLYANDPKTSINFLRAEERRDDVHYPKHLFIIDALQDYLQNNRKFCFKSLVRKNNNAGTLEVGMVFSNKNGQQKCKIEYSDIYDNKYITEQTFDYQIVVYNNKTDFRWKGKSLSQPREVKGD